jgi:serine/threonine-protein kinase
VVIIFLAVQDIAQSNLSACYRIFMKTRKTSDEGSSRETRLVAPFGTSPDLAARLKQANYSGTLLKDRYLIEGELGRGGIGVVYLARDTQLLQRRVVIKVLLQDSENSAHTTWFKKKFEQEIEALARLDHPSIVGVLDAGAMPDGKMFFVMQFVEGVTLRSLMQGDLMSFSRVAVIMRQIGGALNAAHDKGIIHRDLKPENVMIQTLSDGEELVKLIDFGIASVKDSQFSTAAERTKVAGALPYMAPEQLRGQPDVSCDIWAMGVMAYELVTGRLPFVAETMVHLYEEQRKGPQISPSRLRPNLPATAEQTILKALSFNPAERHARARDFGEELFQALSEAKQPKIEPVQSRPSDPTLPLSPEIAREIAGLASIPNAVTEVKKEIESPPQLKVESVPTPRVISGKLVAATAAIVLIVAATIWLSWRNDSVGQQTGGQQTRQESPAPVAPSRLLNYSLKVLARGPNRTPLELAGEIIFSPGDELCFVFNSPQDGHLYIINEGPNVVNGLPQYNFLFPAPDPSGANAPSLRANQQLFIPSEQPPWFVVDEEQGVEKHWLIWAERPIAELEALRKWRNEKDHGEIKDANDIRSAQQFLSQNYPAARPVAEKDERQTHLKGGRDGVLIYQLRLEHR